MLNIGDKLLAVDAGLRHRLLAVRRRLQGEDVRGVPGRVHRPCLFNGAIRNSENEEMAHLLRQKSKVLVAFGSCAYEGCIPALANLTTAEATFAPSTWTALPPITRRACCPSRSPRCPEGEI